MGAWTFKTNADGADPAEAFRTARDEAGYEHGHGRYSGTIAEKHTYIVVTSTTMPIDQAETLADKLISKCDPRINDKWGPAGAIPVCQATRTITVDKLSGAWTSHTLNPAQLTWIAAIARRRGQLHDGETVTEGEMFRATYHPAGQRTTFIDGAAAITISRDPAHLQTQTTPRRLAILRHRQLLTNPRTTSPALPTLRQA